MTPYCLICTRCLNVYTAYFILDCIFYTNFVNEFTVKFAMSYILKLLFSSVQPMMAINVAETCSCRYFYNIFVWTDYLLVLFDCKHNGDESP